MFSRATNKHSSASQPNDTEEILLMPNHESLRVEHYINRQTFVPSPTLSYYANCIPATPSPPRPSPSTDAPQRLRPRGSQTKSKPAPIDMSRIRRASSRRAPKVVVTCDVDGLLEEEEGTTSQVQAQKPTLEMSEVRSSRASVGDMRLLSNDTNAEGLRRDKQRSKQPIADTQIMAAPSSPSIVEIEPGHRFPSWMGGTDYQHLLIDPQAQSHASSRSFSPRPRARGNRISPLSPRVGRDSPESGGPLHQILLTPLSPSDHTWSTDDLLARDSRTRSAKNGAKSGKRRTMLDVASKLLSEQRIKWLRDRTTTSRTPYPGSQKDEKYGYMVHRGVAPSQAGYGLDDLQSAWGAGEKRVLDREAEKKKARKHKWTILIALGILIICSVVVGVCVSLLANRHGSKRSSEEQDKSTDKSAGTTSSSTSSAAVPTSSAATTYDLITCLDMFTLTASSSPLTYPCTQCIGPLSAAKNDFFVDDASDTGPQGVGSALQFCALQTIFKTTEGTGNGGLIASASGANVLNGWMKDTNVCAGWSGIKCDNLGRITTLSLIYPNVPKTLDSSLAHLVALETLKIVGNSNRPSGPIPNSVFPVKLTSLNIQTTSLDSLTLRAFAGSSQKLQTLVLVSNPKLGARLPDLSSSSALQTLSVTGQSLSEDPTKKLPTSLTFLDLSYNALSGAVPDLSRFTALKSLFLDANAYEAFPSVLPSSLQEISLNGNGKLNATVPAEFCNAPQLTSCDFRGSLLSPPRGNPSMTTRAFSTLSRGASTTVASIATVVATVAPTASSSCGICRFD
ncbi:hypothetical protein NliqN6_2462 [Naganishia liquefaciens]|uniref:L domain-like protein n=1 Tax=Naganishia liquefaciens TaxID=104408 RepID=A0A8H3TRV3_9TREE|nr:hypothetical protein NliqN6_2462 [Naganishia liquefaciens]